MTWEVAPLLQPRLWFSNFLNLGNSEDRQQNRQHMSQTKSVFFYDFFRTLTGQYISGRKKEQRSLCDPVWEDSSSECSQRVSSLAMPLKPWKWPLPPSPCYYRHSPVAWLQCLHSRRAPGKALTLLPVLPSSTKRTEKKGREEKWTST